MSHASRKGAALLIALAAVAIGAAAAAGALRAAFTTASNASRRAFEAQSETLCRDLVPRLIGWAERSGGETPRSEGFALQASGAPSGPGAPGGSPRLEVRTLDLSGRLHARWLTTGAAAGLPDALRVLDGLRVPGERRDLTLDDLAAFCQRTRGSAGFSLYTSAGEEDAACDWVTTRGSGALNVNTAPLSLLRAALRGRDPTAAREAIVARSRGEPVPASALARLSGASNAGLALVPLTTSSDAWGFLIAVRQGERAERMWVAIERLPGVRRSGRDAPRFERPLPPVDPARPRERDSAWTVVERRRLGP